MERIGGAQRAGETNRFRFTVMKEDAPAYSVERTIPFDVPYPLISLNDATGVSVLRYVLDGFAEVYDNSGRKSWERNFFGGDEVNYERIIGCVIGKSSVHFLLSDSYREKAAVESYTLTGSFRWRTVLPHQYAYEIALSSDERIIIAGSYLALEDEVRRSALFIDNGGAAMGDIDILFRKAVFADNNVFIALASEREVVVVSGESKKEIARIGKQSAGIITDLIWTGNKLLVQESDVITPNDGRFHYANPLLITYSVELQQLASKKYEGINFKESTLNNNGNHTVLNLDGGKSTIVIEQR
jgi:hypothetical protein